MQEKIVITGMGTINAIGHNLSESWQNALAGVSGLGMITLFDSSRFRVHVACEVKNYQPEDFMLAKDARRRDRYQQFAMIAAKEAIDQSGIQVDESTAGRVGVIVSSAIGGIRSFEENHLILMTEGPRRVNPFVIPMLMPDGAAGLISIEYGFQGPCFSVASACASGVDAIGTAWHMMRAGLIDAAIAGASDATIASVGMAAFDRLGAMSEPVEGDMKAPKPFDLNRDGLIMGEGSAILVLETESRARERSAQILAELAGYAATSDAFHITAPAENGVGGAKAMRMALDAASLNGNEIDYINAHGTGTQLNDLAETLAIKSTLGQHAYQIPISSTKSMTGHMMGTTGALEALFCVKVIQEGAVPPTINYTTPDPLCDLDYVPNQARTAHAKIVMNNAFGFGGHNAVLVIREYN